MTTEEKSKYLGARADVLDRGFVRLVDAMGDDSAIVQAARVSYGKGTKTVREDRALIRYLMRRRHTSPFEMVEFKFHVKLPIFVARQWIRHRTANVNEYSGRFSEMPEEYYMPDPEQLRLQSVVNKQGRSEEKIPDSEVPEIAQTFKESQKKQYEDYSTLLNKGLARELARINLPLSIYTQWYWKIDLHNLLHFLKLRLDPRAQYEIRVYAEKMLEMIKPFVPHTIEAFEDFVLHSISFSKKELRILKQMIRFEDIEHRISASELGKTEEREFKEKLMCIKDIIAK